MSIRVKRFSFKARACAFWGLELVERKSGSKIYCFSAMRDSCYEKSLLSVKT